MSIESKITIKKTTKNSEKKKYRATQKLLDAISKGEFLPDGPVAIERYVEFYECLIDVNSDWTLSLMIDEEGILNNPDFFEEIE